MSTISTITRRPIETGDLDLDIRIVTRGPVSAALLSSTDDGCDTVRGSDC